MALMRTLVPARSWARPAHVDHGRLARAVGDAGAGRANAATEAVQTRSRRCFGIITRAAFLIAK